MCPSLPLDATPGRGSCHREESRCRLCCPSPLPADPRRGGPGPAGLHRRRAPRPEPRTVLRGGPPRYGAAARVEGVRVASRGASRGWSGPVAGTRTVPAAPLANAARAGPARTRPRCRLPTARSALRAPTSDAVGSACGRRHPRGHPRGHLTRRGRSRPPPLRARASGPSQRRR